MIVAQVAMCEECRDGSCRRCKNYLRRQRRKHPHATKSHALLRAAMRAGLPVVEITMEAPRDLAEHERLHQDYLGLPRPTSLLNVPGGK